MSTEKLSRIALLTNGNCAQFSQFSSGDLVAHVVASAVAKDLAILRSQMPLS